MPVISRFYGVDIKMYFRDHFPPHSHAYYGEHSAEMAIEDLRVLAGRLPARALGLVRQWAELHREELQADWERARLGRSLDRIEPLP